MDTETKDVTFKVAKDVAVFFAYVRLVAVTGEDSDETADEMPETGTVIALTLRPGESRAFHTGGRTDEGFSRYDETFSHDGEGIRREWGRQWRDCDGPGSESGEDYCPLDKLTAGEFNPHAGVTYPAWEAARPTRCRDIFAERAGY